MLERIRNPIDDKRKDKRYFTSRQIKKHIGTFENLFLQEKYEGVYEGRQVNQVREDLGNIIDLLKALEKYRADYSIKTIKIKKTTTKELAIVSELLFKSLENFKNQLHSPELTSLINSVSTYVEKSVNQRINHLKKKNFISDSDLTIGKLSAADPNEVAALQRKKSESLSISIKNKEMVFREKLGSGSYGIIYLAELKDKKIRKVLSKGGFLKGKEKHVAIKLLATDAIDHFKILEQDKLTQVEARNVKESRKDLATANAELVREGDIGIEISESQIESKKKSDVNPVFRAMRVMIDGKPAIVSQFLEKGNALDFLRKLHANEGSQYIKQYDRRRLVPHILKNVLDNLSFFHDHGFLHRDVALDNVGINAKNEAKLIDYGKVTKVAENDPQSTVKIKDEHVRWDIMPKEVLFSETYSRNADLHSYQVLILQILSEAAGYDFQHLKDAAIENLSPGEHASPIQIGLLVAGEGGKEKFFQRAQQALLQHLIENKNSHRSQQVFEIYQALIPLLTKEGKVFRDETQKVLSQLVQQSHQLKPTNAEALKQIEREMQAKKSADLAPEIRSHRRNLNHSTLFHDRRPSASEQPRPPPSANPKKKP